MTETNNQYDYKKQSYKKLMFIIIGLIICAVSFVTDIIVGPASLTLSDVWLALTDPAEVSKKRICYHLVDSSSNGHYGIARRCFFGHCWCWHADYP